MIFSSNVADKVAPSTRRPITRLMSSPLKFETQEEALVFFDSLDPITPSELIGLWKGSSLPTGHPLDGALESLGWYGKRFHADRRADALLFSVGSRRLVPLG